MSGLQLTQPLRFKGVKSDWLSTLPDSGTEMLTISSTGVVSRQSIPVASFGALTGSPSDNAALQSALDAKLNLSGGTLTGQLNGTTAVFNSSVQAGAVDIPQNGSNWSQFSFSQSGVGRGALIYDPARQAVGIWNKNYSNNDYTAYVDGSGNFRVRNGATYNSSPVFTVEPTGVVTQSGGLTLNYSSVVSTFANNAYASSGKLSLGGSRAVLMGNISLCLSNGFGIQIYNSRLEPSQSEGLNVNDNSWDIGWEGYNRFRHIYMAGNVVAGSSSAFQHYQRTKILSPSDGKLQITNNAGTSGVQLDFATNGVMSLRNRTDAGAGNFNCGAITASGQYSGTDASLTGNITVPTDSWFGLGSNASRFMPRTGGARIYAGSNLVAEFIGGNTSLTGTLSVSSTITSGAITASGAISCASLTSAGIITANNTLDFGSGTAGSGRINMTAQQYTPSNVAINMPWGTGTQQGIYGSNGLVGFASASSSYFQANSSGLVQIGGLTSSHAAIKRSGTTIQIRNGDDSADGGLSAASGSFTGQVNANNLMLNNYQWIGWGGINLLAGDGLGLRANFCPLTQVTTFGCVTANVSGVLTSGMQTLVADPSTVDITTGLNRMVKNSTSGEVRHWVNDGGTMKSVLFI